MSQYCPITHQTQLLRTTHWLCIPLLFVSLNTDLCIYKELLSTSPCHVALYQVSNFCVVLLPKYLLKMVLDLQWNPCTPVWKPQDMNFQRHVGDAHCDSSFDPQKQWLCCNSCADFMWSWWTLVARRRAGKTGVEIKRIIYCRGEKDGMWGRMEKGRREEQGRKEDWSWSCWLGVSSWRTP